MSLTVLRSDGVATADRSPVKRSDIAVDVAPLGVQFQRTFGH
jgi:hypothetical protein